jgi:hypothetical protein
MISSAFKEPSNKLREEKRAVHRIEAEHAQLNKDQLSLVRF